MDRFAQILFDLATQMGIELHPDQNRICQINYQDELHIQIQYDEAKEHILLAAFLCEVPPGKYREKLLRAGLVYNTEYPRTGTLAYSEKNNQLTLFENIPAANIHGDDLLQHLQSFIEKGLTWKNAVEKGQPLPIKTSKSDGPSIFGMKP